MLNKNLIRTLVDRVWNPEVIVKVTENEIVVCDDNGKPDYNIIIEGEAVVRVEMKRGFKALDYYDLRFINLIDENASEIEVA